MKNKIAVSIMTIALAPSVLIGCGNQNTVDASATSSVSEITADAEETTESIEESTVVEPEIDVEIVPESGRVAGNVMDYSDYFDCIIDGEPYDLLDVGADGYVYVSGCSFSFDYSTFEFNGLTEKDKPEDFLNICVELFGMPAGLENYGTTTNAYWLFETPDNNPDEHVRFDVRILTNEVEIHVAQWAAQLDGSSDTGTAETIDADNEAVISGISDVTDADSAGNEGDVTAWYADFTDPASLGDGDYIPIGIKDVSGTYRTNTGVSFTVSSNLKSFTIDLGWGTVNLDLLGAAEGDDGWVYTWDDGDTWATMILDDSMTAWIEIGDPNGEMYIYNSRVTKIN